jgi:hypothetical protein
VPINKIILCIFNNKYRGVIWHLHQGAGQKHDTVKDLNGLGGLKKATGIPIRKPFVKGGEPVGSFQVDASIKRHAPPRY